MVKKWFLEKMNAFLASLIAFLGVGQSACSQQEIMCKYGVPQAEHVVSGKVINNNGQPLKDMEVEIQIAHENLDRVVTDENGNFEVRQSGFPSTEATIVVTDPVGEFATDTVKVPIKYSSDDAWNRGTGRVDASIKMRRKDVQVEPIVREEKELDNRVICLYGVPNAGYQRISDDQLYNPQQSSDLVVKSKKTKRSKRVKK